MTRTVHLPKPLTPDDRLAHISYAFRHTSAPLGWRGLRVEHDTPQPGSDFVHPPLECLMLVLTGDIFPERTEHRCDDARYNGDGLPHAMNLLPPGVESRWRWRNTLSSTHSTHYQLSPALIAKVAEEAFGFDPARVHFPVRYYDQTSPEVIDTLSALRHELLTGGPGGAGVCRIAGERAGRPPDSTDVEQAGIRRSHPRIGGSSGATCAAGGRRVHPRPPRPEHLAGGPCQCRSAKRIPLRPAIQADDRLAAVSIRHPPARRAG
jgi:hypothetical protein